MASSSMVEIGWLATIVIHSLNLTLLAWILTIRWMRLATDRRRQEMVKVWRPVLAECLLEAPTWLPPIHHRDHILFLYLWNHLQESIKGESSEELSKIIHRTGMDQTVHRFFVHGTMRQKLLATVTLGNLKDMSAWAGLEKQAHADNAFLSIEAARALIRIDAPRALVTLIPLIAQRTDWSPLKILSLLQNAGEEHAAKALGEAALDVPPVVAARLLRILSTVKSHSALPSIRQLLSRTPVQEDVLAAGLTILGHCTDPRDLAVVRQALQHPTWFIRVHAATALGKMGIEDDEDRLIELLADTHWWVRYRAAEALSLLPSMTEDKLSLLVQTLPTTEARKILTPFVANHFVKSVPSLPGTVAA
ncbi:MAG: HEAT repeat domain-containing protein [Nitrospira sp.]|nr:HEAT repeat domain-containing protein [Nitrospira sp.]